MLKGVKGKVIAAFVLAVVAIIAALGITKYSFEGLLGTVNNLARPNEKLRALNNLYQKVIQLDQLQRADAIRRPHKSAEALLHESEPIIRTLDTLRLARTMGCFQIETPPMRSVLRQLPVRGIRDVMAVLAIVRPGPASGDAKARFIRRAAGEESRDPPHALLRERLVRFLGEADAATREFYLPGTVSDLVETGAARVQVVPTDETWFGVTYREDRPAVATAIATQVARGTYPSPLRSFSR